MSDLINKRMEELVVEYEIGFDKEEVITEFMNKYFEKVYDTNNVKDRIIRYLNNFLEDLENIDENKIEKSIFYVNEGNKELSREINNLQNTTEKILKIVEDSEYFDEILKIYIKEKKIQNESTGQ